MSRIVVLKSLSTTEIVARANKKIETNLISETPRKIRWSDKQEPAFRRRVYSVIHSYVLKLPISHFKNDD